MKMKILKLSMFFVSLTFCANFLISRCPGSQPVSVEEITFHSGDFRLVGDLKLPEGKGPHAVVIFVHGDGPNSRISGGSYPPIMARMLRAGYATFAWDKPGSGESTGKFTKGRRFQQRAQIVTDAIKMLKKHVHIDSKKIGLWGISQAGYVMPKVLEKSKDVAFMIAVSCPGESSPEQGAYLLASQAACEGLSPEEAKHLEYAVEAAERAQTYEEYVKNQEVVLRYKTLLKKTGLNVGAIKPKEQWKPHRFKSEYFFNPMPIIEKTKIPVLAFFGEKDTQVDPIQGMKAYKSALEKAGNKNYRVELIPGVDHCMIITKTGSLKEIFSRTRAEKLKYEPLFLDKIEEWLRNLYK